MVGNVYFWEDAFAIGAVKPDADRRDVVKACIPWYEKSIESGFFRCGGNLFTLYTHGDSSGVEPDPEKATALTYRLAEAGHAYAQCELGERLYRGDGVETDYARAFYWLTQAAQQGDEYAAQILALCLFHGRGAARDCEKARALLEGILQKGEIALTGEALCVLGEMCADGLGGSRDAARAAAYLKEAAEKGSEEARIRLAQRRRGGPSAQTKRWPWIVAGAFALLNVFMTVLSVLDNAYVFAAITGVAAVLCFGVAVFLPRGARTVLLCVLITLAAFFGTFALYEYFGW
jgi:TPR repeat protein